MSINLNQNMERELTSASKAIMSPEQADEWESFREGLGDPALLGMDAAQYRRHMQLMVAQLLKGAVAQALGGPAMFMTDVMTGFATIQRVQQLVAQQINDMEPAVREYNRAYGDTTGQWAVRMVQVFEAHACGAKLRLPTVDVMVRYLQSLLLAHKERFARLA